MVARGIDGKEESEGVWVRIAEKGLLPLGRRAGWETKGIFGLEGIEEAVRKAGEVGAWGMQVLVEPGRGRDLDGE